MKARLSGMVLATALLAGNAAGAKTPDECQAEFQANKARIEGAQSEAAFLAACAKGQEVVSGATSSARPAVPLATAVGQPATPAKAAGEAVK